MKKRERGGGRNQTLAIWKRACLRGLWSCFITAWSACSNSQERDPSPLLPHENPRENTRGGGGSSTIVTYANCTVHHHRNRAAKIKGTTGRRYAVARRYTLFSERPCNNARTEPGGYKSDGSAARDSCGQVTKRGIGTGERGRGPALRVSL